MTNTKTNGSNPLLRPNLLPCTESYTATRINVNIKGKITFIYLINLDAITYCFFAFSGVIFTG